MNEERRPRRCAGNRLDVHRGTGRKATGGACRAQRAARRTRMRPGGCARSSCRPPFGGAAERGCVRARSRLPAGAAGVNDFASPGPPADPDRTPEGARVDHLRLLGDLDLSGVHEAPRRPPRVLHPIAPGLRIDRPRRLRGADRVAGATLGQELEDRLLELSADAARPAATRLRAIANLLPVSRPLPSPGEGASTGGADLVGRRAHSGRRAVLVRGRGGATRRDPSSCRHSNYSGRAAMVGTRTLS